jgi:hypothetical protein
LLFTFGASLIIAARLSAEEDPRPEEQAIEKNLARQLRIGNNKIERKLIESG